VAYAARALLLVLAADTLVACDFKVTNPGPVPAENLDSRATAAGIVNGAGRDLSDALSWIAYTGGAISREVFPAGSTGSFGISAQQQVGKLLDDDTNNYWQLAQRARFEAEDGANHLKGSLGANFAKDTLGAKILIWAGYANRLLGENMCDAVINGGSKQAYTVYLTRADSEFTEALAIAVAASVTKFVNVALAARAAVRLDLGRVAEAVTDANSIADTFVNAMPYFTTDQDQYNRIFWATANQPYRAHTVWNTVYDQYYTDTKDPRVPWASDPNQSVGDAAVLSLGRVTWHKEMKFAKQDAPINLSSGWEMRLIAAEAALLANNLASAMPLINKHRVALGLQPWTASTIDDGWTALRRERGIELWLEGRRLNDLRRWKAGNAPGTMSPLEQPGTGTNGAPSYLTQQDLCFPIPLSEKQNNPNLAGP
jgi:starch-binding outer membrane protein, SusD/RagB family